MTSSDYKITFSCANCCKHSSGISHDPSLISCSVAELRAWQQENKGGDHLITTLNQRKKPGVVP